MTAAGSLAAAFLVGLLGGVHCVGMCGGIVGTLTMGLPREARLGLARLFPYQLAYNVGRMAGYTLAGALMGALGTLAVQAMPIQYAQRGLYALAAVFMILLGLYLGGWWRGLARIERLGAGLWRRLEPLGRRLLPVRSPLGALGLGFIWAWIPCGLVYSVLIWAVSAGSAFDGALLMLAFGLGTLPNLLGMGMLAGAAARFTDQVWIRQAAGVLVLGFGLYALWQLFAA
ncbi:MAG: sulfite exporter TauE/SafE family protein [Pseudomonadota bacterium]|nr:sulfite exporter TauE/SafE family protein [Pseudomonadota bacterium]